MASDPRSALDRRTLLKAAGLNALGVAAAGTLLPGCEGEKKGKGITTGADSGEDPGDALDLEGWELIRARIDTVVVLVMENRSFDHYLGARKLVEGDDRVEGLSADLSNPHPEGGVVTVFPTDDFCVEDPPHSWNGSHNQWNEGANDGFVREFYEREPHVAHQAMGYWTRETLPAYYALADAYALCDRWFCSVMSSTWPNRFYVHCAQSGGMRTNDRPPEDTASIYPRLTAAGRSWATYFSNLPFLALVPGMTADPASFRQVERFFQDAEAGTLPNMVVLEPVFGRADDHPPAHPVAGQVFVSAVYDALSRSPQWERTLFIITYDEHGGFFDHVPPPKAADDRPDEGFDQLGFRVPTLVCGPWVKPGHVSHVVRDHSSILAFIEKLFEVEPLTARDAAADPMDELLDEEAMQAGTAHAPAVLDPIEADEAELYAEECLYELVAPGPRDAYITRQPELEIWADAHIAGTFLDRRAETDEIYEWLLSRAEKAGLLRRATKPR